MELQVSKFWNVSGMFYNVFMATWLTRAKLLAEQHKQLAIIKIHCGKGSYPRK